MQEVPEANGRIIGLDHISSGGSARTIFIVSRLTVITRRRRSKG
jgi:hypothetical protein